MRGQNFGHYLYRGSNYSHFCKGVKLLAILYEGAKRKKTNAYGSFLYSKVSKMPFLYMKVSKIPFCIGGPINVFLLGTGTEVDLPCSKARCPLWSLTCYLGYYFQQIYPS